MCLVETLQVHRQKGGSAIIDAAHKVLHGTDTWLAYQFLGCVMMIVCWTNDDESGI